LLYQEIGNQLQFDQTSLYENYFIIDDTVFPKRGKLLLQNSTWLKRPQVGPLSISLFASHLDINETINSEKYFRWELLVYIITGFLRQFC
jgi:hypothetical protein